MKITLLHRTNLGKWSVIVMITNIVIFALGSVLPWKPDYSGFQIIVYNPMQTLITVLMLVTGIVTLCTGLISVAKEKERSILVFLAILIGLYSILGFFGSIATVFYS